MSCLKLVQALNKSVGEKPKLIADQNMTYVMSSSGKRQVSTKPSLSPIRLGVGGALKSRSPHTLKVAGFLDKVKTVGKNIAKGPRHLAQNAALASAKGQMASGKKLSPKLKKRVGQIGKSRGIKVASQKKGEKKKKKTLTPKTDAWIARNPKKALAGAVTAPVLGMAAINQYKKRKKK